MKSNKVMEGPRDGEIRCQACFTPIQTEVGCRTRKMSALWR